jgi:protein-S-isoprenylcysteine O-methyltransferase Ste14
MGKRKRTGSSIGKRFAARGAIVLSFIVALEIAIMISPFAFYFYAAFNPFLLALNQSPITRWLTAFFLPHMVVPPNGLLAAIRVTGSVFFVLGMVTFLICASQVYLGKVLKKGVATRGLYSFIRHPQYLGLSLAALGLAIMWPRFLTLVLFAVMLFLYYILARDEERRMTNRYGESYEAYRRRTGMFFPHRLEKVFIRDHNAEGLRLWKASILFLALLIAIVGSGFIARAYTVHHLALEQIDHVDVIAIAKDDLTPARQTLTSILKNPAISSKVKEVGDGTNHRLLAYFIPVDYVMQGMIADTGGEWRLFEQHKTIGMITDYIFHPFSHLTEGHAHHLAMEHHDSNMHDSPEMKRRIIFIQISGGNRTLRSSIDDFGINNIRKPLFFVDVHLHTGVILQVQEVPSGSGWGTVPTPMF